MLLFGFLGEKGIMNKNYAFAIAIVAFTLLFYFIYEDYVKDKADSLNLLYGLFLFVWFLYGVAYYLPVMSKNIMYNILDIIAKSAFGIFLWTSTITDLDN